MRNGPGCFWTGLGHQEEKTASRKLRSDAFEQTDANLNLKFNFITLGLLAQDDEVSPGLTTFFEAF